MPLDHPDDFRTDTGYCEQPAPADEADALAEILEGHSGTWVTFRRGFDLRLDQPYSNQITPHAVYGLDSSRIATFARDFAKRIRSAKTAARKRDLPFHAFHALGYTRRPDAVVFSVEGRALSTESYLVSPDDLGDWTRLRDYVGERHPGCVGIVERWKPRREYDRYMSFRWAMWMTEKSADVIVGATGDTDAAFKAHPDKPRVWRELLQAMGFDAVVDRSGFLTGDSVHEIAVLNPASITVLAASRNPAAAERGIEEEPGAAFSARPRCFPNPENKAVLRRQAFGVHPA